MEKDVIFVIVGLVATLFAALWGLVILFFKTALNKIWGELKSLREVRHDDTDSVTEVSGKLTIMEFIIKDLKQDLRQLAEQVKVLLESKHRRRNKDGD